MSTLPAWAGEDTPYKLFNSHFLNGSAAVPELSHDFQPLLLPVWIPSYGWQVFQLPFVLLSVALLQIHF
jgi:hypothetical protein